MKAAKFIVAALVLTGCVHTGPDLRQSERLFFQGYANHLAAFGLLPAIETETKLRVPEFDLIVLPGPFQCSGKTVTGCLSLAIELKDGKAVKVYQIRLTGKMVDGKIYLNPDVLTHEIEHLLHRENPVFVDPHKKYK